MEKPHSVLGKQTSHESTIKLCMAIESQPPRHHGNIYVQLKKYSRGTHVCNATSLETPESDARKARGIRKVMLKRRDSQLFGL
jgi:hypothetical protein